MDKINPYEKNLKLILDHNDKRQKKKNKSSKLVLKRRQIHLSALEQVHSAIYTYFYYAKKIAVHKELVSKIQKNKYYSKGSYRSETGNDYLIKNNFLEENWTSNGIEYLESKSPLSRKYCWQEVSCVKNLLILKLAYLFREIRIGKNKKRASAKTDWKLVRKVIEEVYKAQRNEKVLSYFFGNGRAGLENILIQKSDWDSLLYPQTISHFQQFYASQFLFGILKSCLP